MEAPSPPIGLLVTLVLLFLFCVSFADAACHPTEEKALLEIKNTFFTPEYETFSDWDPKTTPDCCKWSNLACDVNGHVTSLSFYPFPYLDAREIPTAVGDLTFLETLEIQDANLTGPIPAVIGTLTNLQSLTLRNGLTGPIPESLGQLKKLNFLDLDSNSLTALPSTMGQLTNLSILYLFANQLAGPIPAGLGRLRKLQVLYLSNNRFTGPIPGSLSRLPQLDTLDLSANQLTGSIPASFGSFKNPRLWLDLSQNRLSGPLPKSLGKTNITQLVLSMNQLTGDASFLFGKDKSMLATIKLDHNNFKFDFSNVDLPMGIRNLDISHNEIYGSLPKRLGQLPLQSINVSYNNLCGMIPTGRRLKRFSPDSFAHNKCLCGPPLPPCQ